MFGRKGWACTMACIAILVVVALAGVAGADSPLTDVEQVGSDMYFDANLSVNDNVSCASCHAPEVGWTGPDEGVNAAGAVYPGSIAGRFGNRKPPSSAYATQAPIFYMDNKGNFVGGNFWDGRATGEKLGNPAADQAQGPPLNPLEMAMPDSACVVYEICNADYAPLFEQVWGAGVCDIPWPDMATLCVPGGFTIDLADGVRQKVESAYDAFALSVAAFEASPEVNAFTSKYDLSLRGMAKLTQQERLGFALFNGKGKCSRCHISHGQMPLFTDYTYDNLGVPKNPDNPFYTELDFNPLGADWIDYGLGGYLESAGYDPAIVQANNGKFKVPTLRNVDLRPYPDFVKAYSHNGYFKSLEGIVHFYNTRDVLDVCPGDYTEAEALAANCWPPPEVSANLNTGELGNLGLTPDEEAAIVAFLKTLSDQ